MKSIFAAAALALALLITPAKAYDELVSHKLTEVRQKLGKEVKVRLVTDAEKTNLAKYQNLPDRKGKMHLLTEGSVAMLLIVRDDIIVSNSPPLPSEIITKLLKGEVPKAPEQPAPKGEKL